MSGQIPKELSSFRNMVRTMRTLQKAWFKDKRPSDLQASKEYEKRVDKWLENDAQGPDLFANQSEETP